jgi:hypothetical protein
VVEVATTSLVICSSSSSSQEEYSSWVINTNLEGFLLVESSWQKAYFVGPWTYPWGQFCHCCLLYSHMDTRRQSGFGYYKCIMSSTLGHQFFWPLESLVWFPLDLNLVGSLDTFDPDYKL